MCSGLRVNRVLAAASRDQHVWPVEPFGFSEHVIGLEGSGAIEHALNVSIGVEIQVRSVHLEPHVGVVLNAFQRVLRACRFIQK